MVVPTKDYLDLETKNPPSTIKEANASSEILQVYVIQYHTPYLNHHILLLMEMLSLSSGSSMMLLMG
jgi:hypothetical protein